MNHFALAAAITFSLGAHGHAAGQKPPAPALDVILARAGAYLADYEKSFSSVVAEERYFQMLQAKRGVVFAAPDPGQRRALRADVIAVTDAGHAWMTFRDVYSVDGRQVRDRDERLQKLFIAPRSDPMGQARLIADEGARFNLGTVSRNVNFPTMPLTFLAREYQPRSRFHRAGTGKVGGVETVILAFEETERPTIVKSGEDDLPASGRFWVEPLSGRAMKAVVRLENRDFTSETTVTFGYVDKVKMWLPVEMNDLCTTARETVTGRATYSNFRRFAVTTDVVIK